MFLVLDPIFDSGGPLINFSFLTIMVLDIQTKFQDLRRLSEIDRGRVINFSVARLLGT